MSFRKRKLSNYDSGVIMSGAIYSDSDSNYIRGGFVDSSSPIPLVSVDTVVSSGGIPINSDYDVCSIPEAHRASVFEDYVCSRVDVSNLDSSAPGSDVSLSDESD